MSKSCYYCPSAPTSMALDERNSISKFDTFPWFSVCTRTCEKIQDLGDFRDEAQSSLRVDWCRNPVNTVLVDPLAWLWTKEIQFRNLTHFLDFSACTRTSEKFRIWDLGDFRDEAQSRPSESIDVESPCYYCPSGPTSMALDERNSISKFDPFPWFSACTRTCEKFRIWVIFGMKLKVVLRVDWCRNPVTTVLVDPLAWLWTKEIQFRNFTHFLDFRPVRGPAKNSGFGWFSGWSSK